MSGFIAVGHFLTSLFFDLIFFVLWARIALRYFRVSSVNSFSRLIYSLTNPILLPFHHLIHYHDSAKKRYDWPTLIIITLIEFIKISLLCLISYHKTIPILWAFVYVGADLIVQPCNFLFYAILIRTIMSYANPHWHHPLNDFLRMLTNPLLIFGRRLIPDISGFDFSPLVMIALLKTITLFIYASLPIPLL